VTPGGAGGRDLGLDAGTLPPSSYVRVTRTWKTGDVVELTIPKSLRLEPTPDDASVAALMWGPLVLAGDLGPRRDGSRRERASETPIVAPTLVTDDRPVEQWVVPNGARAGDFRVVNVARSLVQPSAAVGDVSLTPFYRTHGRTYSVYFDVLPASAFDARVKSRAESAARERELEAATVAFVQPGNPQAEQTFNYRSEPAERPIARMIDRSGRGGPGWFSYDVPIDASVPSALVITYHNDLGLPVLGSFDIQADGATIGRYTPNRVATEFWSQTYDLPMPTPGKNKVTVRFQSTSDGRIVPVYGLRVIRLKQP